MLAEITGRFIHATTHAILIECKTIQGDMVQRWIAKSTITYKRIGAMTQNEKNPECVVRVPIYIAESKGVDYEEVG